MTRYEGGETTNQGMLTRSGISVTANQPTAIISYWKWKLYYIYYPLKHLFDGRLDTFYSSSARDVKVSLTFPRKLYVHHLEVYPVSMSHFVFAHL